MNGGITDIEKKLRSFKSKYHQQLLIKGLVITATILLAYFLFVVFLEYKLWLSSWWRLSFLVVFASILVYAFNKYLKSPILWMTARKGMGDEQSARIIGKRMPEVGDRLVNLIQLETSEHTSLTEASVRQRSGELVRYNYNQTIDYSDVLRLSRFLVIPVLAFLLLSLFKSEILTSSTTRILQFNREFVPEAPFSFVVENRELTGYYNEDFTLNVRVEGESLPESVYLITDGRKLKLTTSGDDRYAFIFDNLQTEVDFHLEGGGFNSGNYSIALAHRPELNELKVEVVPPSYTRLAPRSVNSGNLEVPEGSALTWNLNTSFAESALIRFDSGEWSRLDQSADKGFSFTKSIRKHTDYEISMRNEAATNKERISYTLEIIPDHHPKIVMNSLSDSILYKSILVGGVIGDDYGLTNLELVYSISDKNDKTIEAEQIAIPIQGGQTQQSFVYTWNLEGLPITTGSRLSYYLRVWDNDGVNGRKFSRTPDYTFNVPTEEEIIAEIDNSKRETTRQIDRTAGKASSLQQKIEDATQRIKGKQSLDWQDKKMLEEIAQEKDALQKLIDEFKNQNQLNNEKSQALMEQDERIRQKAEQIQKLMEDLLDEETKKLFDELRKLLQENADPSEMKNLLDKLNKDTQNLEKELDRILKLAKDLQFEAKYEQVEKMLSDLIEEQKELMNETSRLEKEKPGDRQEQSKDLGAKQDELKKEAESIKEQIGELDQLKEETDNQMEVPESGEMDETMENQEESQESLEQNNPSQSKQSQQKAIQKMQQMKDQMESSSAQAGMEIDMENMEMLKQIVHGLLKLSFDQETLLKTFRELNQGDPRFNTLAEEQLQLKDNAKVLEDSLLALAGRDPFLGSFVMKEVSDLNEHLDKVNESNRERRRPQAQTEMQASMTSLNNLALMLDSHYDMMMQMMANAKPSMKSKSKQQGKSPSLSQLQMELNQKIQDLKNSGKSGRQLSEELAKMAAEQESIRRAIEELQEKMKNEGGMPGGDLPSKMEQTEMDLVNKQLTDQLIKRQQEILTRLLESEKSMREQEEDEERKGETAKDYERQLPREFEEYLRLKEKEVELLKTVPPKLLPYYRQEVDGYFQRIGNQ